MEKEDRDYFKLQKIILKAMGISLYKNNGFLYKIYSILSLIIVVCFYTLIESYGMYVFFDDIDKLASLVSLGVTHILGAIKVFVLLKNKKKIQKTLENLEEGIFKPNKERGGGYFEKELISNCIKITQKQSFAYYTPATIVWAFVMIRPIVTKIKYEDYKMWQTPGVPFSLFELKKSPDFELVSIFQGICLTIFSYIISSTDLLIVGFIAHMKTQLLMLRNAIKRVTLHAATLALKDGFGVDLEDPSTIPKNYLKLALKKIVIYHQSIIKLAYDFEDQFNVLVLTVFLANTAILCFTMYHASLYPITNERSLQDFAFIVTISTQVFLYCYWGNELALESEKVAWTCYESDFVGAGCSFQKSLVLIMNRSQKPILLTAGKFTNLSLMTFVGILRLSYSYYMVLRRNNEQN
ncbi:odorant receptor 82a-like [Onthophagus taurus]|uniref:odorant receptor 82a-like n=1 Tax=Onthophagus taurus TaxID=166361 RepID=UPI0039BECFA7